jgi:TP901 family phage tail tape measure protein
MAGGSAVFLDVLPSMARFGTNLTRNASVQAAKAGQAVGRTFSAAMDAGAAKGGSGATAAVAQLEAAAKKAERVIQSEKARIYQARQAEVAATKQVAAAEAGLAAQRAKHGAESAQALRAEAGLATARGKVGIMSTRTTAIEDQLRAAYSEQKVITQQLGAAQNVTTKRTGLLARGMSGLARAGEPIAGAMGLAAGGIRRVAVESLATLKPLASMAGGFAAIVGIGKVVTLGNQYTKTMNELQAVTASTDTQMAQTSATARALGSDLSLPATSGADAAAIMVELAKGGMTLKGSMDAAKGTIQLAAAAQIDGATAAEVQANALNQFGLAAKDAGMVADVLANTANAAAGGVTDIATSLKYVGPVARSLGIDVKDTASSIGLLANQGLKGDTAGTALRGMLASLAKPSKQAQKGVDALGLSVFDSQGKFVGMRAVIESLSKAQKEMTQEQFAVNSVLAFGREPLAAITALASEGTKGFDGMSKAVGRQGGAAEVAQSQMKGLGGAMDKLESQLEDVALSIYQTVTPALTAAANGIAGGLDGASGKVEGFLKSAGAISKLAATGVGGPSFTMDTGLMANSPAVKGILAARGLIVGALGDIRTFITSGLIPSLKNAAVAVLPLVAIFGGIFLAVLRGVAAVLAHVIAPALVAVTGFFRDNQWAAIALAGVLSTLVLAYLSMRVVPAVIGAVTTATLIAKRAQEGFALASYGTAAAMQAQGRAGKLGVATFVLWKVAVTTAKAVGFAFVAATRGMAAAQIAFNIAANANPLGLLVLGIVAVVAAVTALVAGVIWAYKNLGWFKTAVDAVWSGIQIGVKAVGAAAVWLWQSVFVPAWKGIATAAMWAWTNVLQPAFTGIVVGGKAVGAAFVWLWQSVIQPTFAWIGNAARAVGGAFVWLWQSVVSPVLTWIGNAARGLWDGFLFPVFDLIRAMVRTVLGAAFVWLRDSVIVPVVNGIVTALRWFSGVASSVFLAVVGFVRNTLGAAFVWLRDTVILPVFNGLVSVTLWWWRTTVSNFTAVVNFVRGVLGAVFTWLRDSVIRPVFTFIAGVFVTWWSGVRATFTAVVSFLRSTLGPVFTWLRDSVIRPVFDGIKGAISNTWRNGIRPIFDAVKNFAMKTIPDAFTKMKEGVKGAWDAVKTTAKAPIKFVVNTVINDALIGNFNKVATAFGTKKMSTISLPEGFNRGGVVPGYQPAKRDDAGLHPLRRGEGILVPEVVRALGPSFVHGLNRAGNTGGVGAVKRAAGFAQGGVVGAVTSGWDWAKGAAGKAWDWGKNAAETAANVVTDPMGTLGKLVKSVIGRIPGAGNMVDMAGGMGRKVLDTAVSVLKRIGEGGSGAGTGKNGDLPRSALMKVSGFAPGSGVGAMGGYLRIAAARAWQMMQKASGGALGLTEGYRDLANQNKRWAMYRAGGNLAALPGTSVHGLGNAADIGAGQGWARANGARYGWVNTGLGFSQREPWHFEYKGRPGAAAGGMALGGIVDRPSLYDDGGELQVGTHLYAKNTREPEYALPEGRLVEIVEKASRNSGGSGDTVNLTATIGGTGNHHEDLRDVRRAVTNRRRGGRGRKSR